MRQSVRQLIFRRYSSKQPKDLETAFTQRLEQLESEYVEDDDALLGKEFKALIDKDQQSQKRFQYEHQATIQATKIPSYASNQSRQIANSTPWSGNEQQHDTALRMLVDKHKPLKVKSSVKKLASAKETVLDYKLNKDAPDEDSAFRNIYKEKFTPIGSFDKIKTLADARIEEAMRQGQFKNIPRGKKLDTEVKPFVDRTEHHLNNILIKQNISPPWIEKQGGVNNEISNFRNELKKKWITHIDVFYNPDESQMRKEFRKKWKSEYENIVRLVNNSIRTYNLQAPMSTQKFYLIQDKEFDRCFDEVNAAAVREKVRDDRLKKEIKEENEKQTSNFSLKFWKWGAIE